MVNYVKRLITSHPWWYDTGFGRLLGSGNIRNDLLPIHRQIQGQSDLGIIQWFPISIQTVKVVGQKRIDSDQLRMLPAVIGNPIQRNIQGFMKLPSLEGTLRGIR